MFNVLVLITNKSTQMSYEGFEMVIPGFVLKIATANPCGYWQIESLEITNFD